MPVRDIDYFLSEVLGQYYHHIQASDAYINHTSYPNPDLANIILPMFHDRWATGPGQHTAEIYPFIKESFQLASRFSIEPFSLMWFYHLTFGERRRNDTGTYIVPTPHLTSADAIIKIQENIAYVGRLVTFMFQPPNHHSDDGSAVTCRFKHHQPLYHEIKGSDWPPISLSIPQGYGQPLVVINNHFQGYFRRHVHESSQDETYRVPLILVSTLVHEFCHAYEFWLSPEKDEPRWEKSDKKAELGWSWERIIIGCELRPFRDLSARCLKAPFLYVFEVEEYHCDSERENMFMRLMDPYGVDSVFTNSTTKSRVAVPSLLEFREISSDKDCGEDNPLNFTGTIQVLPMDWIVNWFREESWI